MQTYSIKQAENLSGIKAHTLRIWEKRYGIITPLRTDTNIRQYDNKQILKLINISSLLKYGIKISKIAKLNDQEIVMQLNDRQAQKHTGKPSFSIHINNLLTAAIQYDEKEFNRELSSSIVKYGMRTTYIEIISPLLIKIGLMWRTSLINPSQEHFVSNLIKQKLFYANEETKAPQNNGTKWVLFLKEGEYHEIGLLFASYLLRSTGHSVYYLGQSVPLENITQTVKEIDAERLLTFICESNNYKKTNRYINQLTEQCQKTKIVVCGSRTTLNKLTISQKADKIDSIESLIKKHMQNP